MLIINANIRIPSSEFEITYVRSSGPGGQNVNKVNSKAVLRWNLLESPSLPLGARARLIENHGSRLTREGDLILTSDRFRDQGRNREDCLDKLRALIAQAAVPPKQRRETKPSRSSIRRAETGKRNQSEKKSLRRRPSRDE